MYSYSKKYSTVILSNSTLSGNSAGVSGGGVDSWTQDDSTVILSRSLISGNTAPSGAEVYYYDFGGTLTADNHNLFGHSGLSDAQAFFSFTPGSSDIDATSDGTNTPLSAILNTTLADNGGLTYTHALVDGSPAIDVSPDTDCEATDQRGVTRPQGAACDIGAFELEAAPDLDPLCPGLVPTLGCTVNGVRNQPCLGTAGKDKIVGTKGNDVILGLGDNDTLLGKKGDDILCGGAGNDNLRGGPGNDQLLGASEDDTLKGDNGNDDLDEGAGTDSLNGGKGTDTCVAFETLKACEA